MALQQRIAFEQAEYLAEQYDENDPENSGVQFDVLIDRVISSPAQAGEVTSEASRRGSEPSVYQGRAYFQAPQIDATTFVQSREPLSPGELVRCTIVGADAYDLIARPSAELEKRVSLPLA